MPQRVECHESFRGGNGGEYTAGYSNYRKFQVASGIAYQPVP